MDTELIIDSLSFVFLSNNTISLVKRHGNKKTILASINGGKWEFSDGFTQTEFKSLIKFMKRNKLSLRPKRKAAWIRIFKPKDLNHE